MKYEYKVTWEDMLEAQATGYPVTIIINGEYYEMKIEEEENEK